MSIQVYNYINTRTVYLLANPLSVHAANNVKPKPILSFIHYNNILLLLYFFHNSRNCVCMLSKADVDTLRELH